MLERYTTITKKRINSIIQFGIRTTGESKTFTCANRVNNSTQRIVTPVTPKLVSFQ